jgi:hypothetical protein
VSTRGLCVVGNEVHRATLTPNGGLWGYRERQEVHTFSAAMYAGRLASALVLPEIGVLGSDGQFPQTYS